MTKKCNRLRGERPKAFWGALVGGAMNLIGSAISSKSQARAIRRQIEAQKEAARTQLELANNSNLASTLNSYATATRSYNDEDDYNLKYRLGGNKRLGSNRIYITDGGNATKIDNGTYLLRGGSHEQTNETGQTGIGINVGGNEIEAEGGEVAQKKNGALRIFSAQPILGGISPAQAIMRGYNKDKVFNAQQKFKKNNGIKDDGSQQRIGGEVPYNHYDPTGLFGGSPHPLAKMIDITGITSYGDVKKLINKKRRGEIPTTQEYLGALSAIPGIGRIPKALNLIGNVADATTFMKDVKESEAKEKAYQNEVVKYMDIHGRIKTGRRGSMPYSAHELRKRYGGLTSKDRGSSKHPYPSVSSKDFAGGGRSYPIPTKADAVDALRLAGLHGRSDVKAKVYSRYPELRKKAEMGTWVKPVYNTSKYRGTSRARKQIAKWEGSDFAGQNAQFKGDAIGAKERELRQFMGKAYNYLNDNQRDALLSYYYNVVPKSFRGQMTKYRNALINAQTEQEYNDTLNNMRESINIGANRKGMSGLRNRRAIERSWFGYTTPMNTNQTRAILKQQDDARMVQPIDNTRVVIQPEYIEVPAPVGHGIVPVDNPDPNLLQGNIKDNLINMGNKFRLGQRCGGSTRMRKALGGESRPVKGMRRKLAWGDVTYPHRRNNNFDYWDIIDQEQKANDKGGISPWTTSNNYDVKVPYAITKSTPTIPYTSKVNTPTSGVSENKTIPTYIGNKSGMIIRDADWYGLGADLVSSIGGSILGLGAYKNLDFDYNLPNFVEESPVALNTTYHNEAQKSNVERNRLNSRNSILRNTMSGSTAVGRMQGVDTNALYQLNQLADEKTNKETELMNQNLLNEQQVRARNAAARNQYYNTVASIKNAAIQAKNEAELAKGQILSGSLQGIGNSFQNFISQGRQNYDDTQAMLMGVAASDYATPSRLLELGIDVGDDAALAGIYRSAMNVPNPGARPKREDYSDNTEYSYALTRWENQNKAYQRRNSYADLIKGRMSKKNLIKYGII